MKKKQSSIILILLILLSFSGLSSCSQWQKKTQSRTPASLTTPEQEEDKESQNFLEEIENAPNGVY